MAKAKLTIAQTELEKLNHSLTLIDGGGMKSTTPAGKNVVVSITYKSPADLFTLGRYIETVAPVLVPQKEGNKKA